MLGLLSSAAAVAAVKPHVTNTRAARAKVAADLEAFRERREKNRGTWERVRRGVELAHVAPCMLCVLCKQSPCMLCVLCIHMRPGCGLHVCHGTLPDHSQLA